MAAQDTIAAVNAMPVRRRFTADDEDAHPAMWMQYVGSEASGKIAVAAGGDISFTHGDVGAEVADTTIGLPTKNGTIDVSDATADTLGEIRDHIENVTPNWRCFIEAGLRADSSNDTLETFAATGARTDAGIVLNFDGSVATFGGYAITGHEFVSRVNEPHKFMDGMRTDEGCICMFDYAVLNVAMGGLTRYFRIYEATQTAETLVFQDEFPNTTTKYYGMTTGHATYQSFEFSDKQEGFHVGPVGSRLVIRAMNTGGTPTYTAVTEFRVHGRVFDYTGKR